MPVITNNEIPFVTGISTPSKELPPDIKQVSPEKTLTGKIVRLNRPRFCGAVRADGPDPKEDFFLGSQVRETNFNDIKEGDVVSFTIIPNDRKPGEMMASNVRRIEPQAGTPPIQPPS